MSPAVQVPAVSDTWSMPTIALLDGLAAALAIERLLLHHRVAQGTILTSQHPLGISFHKYLVSVRSGDDPQTQTIYLPAGWEDQHSRTLLAARRVCCHHLGLSHRGHSHSHPDRLAHPSKSSKASSALHHPTELWFSNLLGRVQDKHQQAVRP